MWHRSLRPVALGLLALLAVGGILWAFRVDLALTLIRRAAARELPTGPTETVRWSSGQDPLGRPRGGRPPNVVLILADDLGWNDPSFGGGGVADGRAPTPHIDSIASEGVVFSNGYAGNATCAPSRASLLSGRYATRFGFEFTPTPPGMMRIVPWLRGADPDRLHPTILHADAESMAYDDMGMPASEITLAEVLASAGYHTIHIGKWHLGRSAGMAPHDQGFAESLMMASGLYLPEDDPNVVNARQEFDPIDRFLWARMRYAASFNGGPAFEPDGYLTDYYGEQAVRAIEANRDRPFFLYLAHWAPHTPLQATRADYEALSHIPLHRERVYAAMIRSLDRSIGRVLEALEANGLSEDTLVLFSSDNGGAGYIGLPEVNAPFRGWKMTLFEGGLHVPFFMKWPARIEAGRVFDAPVHHFDLFATAAAAASAALPHDRTIDGVDLLPFILGEDDRVPHRSLFWRSGASRTALVDGWKLNVSDPPGRRWLFHLASDPTERQNLAEARPGKVAELEAALAAHEASQSTPLWPSQADLPINVDKDLSRRDSPEDDVVYWSN